MSEQDLIAIPYQEPTTLPKINAQSLLDSFLSGKSQRTIEAYRRDLDDFRNFLSVENVKEAARIFLSRSLGEANSIALQYRKQLLERGLHATTVTAALPLSGLSHKWPEPWE